MYDPNRAEAESIQREDVRESVESTIDFDAHYTVAGYRGIAFYLLGYEMVRDADYDWTGIEEENREMVRAVMVGDDRVHIVDVDDLTPLDELDYCAVCGQVGCSHDGRDRA